MVLLTQHYYLPALLLFILNRLLDGIDGYVAKVTLKESDMGALLDIFSDYIIYLGFLLSIAFLSQSNFSVLFSIIITLSLYCLNLLAWSFPQIIKGRDNPIQVYSSGLIEGFETVVVYIILISFPSYWLLTINIFNVLLIFTIIIRLTNFNKN